jgi:predicted DNA-binding protein (MmcQ/YjbR family)
VTHRPLSSARARAATETLRAFGLGYPEAHEDHPWGEIALKVRGKVFVFLGGNEDGGLGLSVKLPRSQTAALDQPWAQPTGYGLGKSGWVSARFAPDEAPPLELLREWIDESYRAVAPKKLVAALDGTTAKQPAGTPSRAAKAGAQVRAKKAASRKKASRAQAKPSAATAKKKRARG